MTSRATADANGVVSLRLQIEQRIKRGKAVDSRERDVELRSHVLQRFRREILVRMVLLHRLENPKQCAGMPVVLGYGLVDIGLFGTIRQRRQSWHVRGRSFRERPALRTVPPVRLTAVGLPGRSRRAAPTLLFRDCSYFDGNSVRRVTSGRDSA